MSRRTLGAAAFRADVDRQHHLLLEPAVEAVIETLPRPLRALSFAADQQRVLLERDLDLIRLESRHIRFDVHVGVVLPNG